MRPKAEWAIDSEAIWARGIIFKYCITKQQIDNEVYKWAVNNHATYTIVQAMIKASFVKGGGRGEGYHYFLWQESLCRDRYAVNSSHIWLQKWPICGLPLSFKIYIFMSVIAVIIKRIKPRYKIWLFTKILNWPFCGWQYTRISNQCLLIWIIK